MDLILYVADDIQTLINGKQVLTGLYPDRVVIALSKPEWPEGPTEQAPFAIQTLSLLVCLTGMPVGRHDVDFDILSPTGQPMQYSRRGMQTEAQENGSVSLVIQISPFVFQHLGNYVVRVRASGLEATGVFEMRVAKKAPTISRFGDL
jgi:hypothetical protein